MADDVATKIRKARTDASLNREQLAVALGVSLSTVVRWETGRTDRISLATVTAIAKATGKPIKFFLDGAVA